MSYKPIGCRDAHARIDELLVGNSIAGFECGDVWALRLSDPERSISFHSLGSSSLPSIEEVVRANAWNTLPPSDAPLVAWSILLTTAMRRRITATSLDETATLLVKFEGGLDLSILTDTPIVDWQWSIASDSRNPYESVADIACFWRSEIVVRETE